MFKLFRHITNILDIVNKRIIILTIRELCSYLNITTPTLYNWKKDKPNLYKIVMDFKENNDNNLDKKEQTLLKLFRQLENLEQDFYISEINTRILKRKIENKE